MELKWLGWASWLIKTGGKIIYIDPFKGKITEKADIILSSHNHPDHCDINKINEMKKDSTIILTPEPFADAINAEPLNVGQTKKIGNIKIEAVNAYNLKIPNHQKGKDAGFIIEAEGKRIYFAADTDLIPEMNEIKNIDIALLPIGGTFTMDIEQAVKAVNIIKPKIVIPMHYGVLEVISERKPIHVELKVNLEEFRKKIGNAAKAVILKHGESFKL
jgi:L-ascorbate metabolism protein UlaG (beta-lactamase superfamily)